MLETAAVGSSGGRAQQAGSETSRALAMVAQSVGPGHGLAVFDKKGELSRVEGVTVFPGGVVDVKALGAHLQHGDVDFQVLCRLAGAATIPACVVGCGAPGELVD